MSTYITEHNTINIPLSAVPENFFTSGAVSGISSEQPYVWFLSGDCPKDTIYPIADFTYVVDPVLNSVVFTDKTSGLPTAWLWNFGDSSTSILQNPIHTYSTLGTYTVTLSASNENGSDITSQSIDVHLAPISNPILWWEFENNLVDSIKGLSGTFLNYDSYNDGYMSGVIGNAVKKYVAGYNYGIKVLNDSAFNFDPTGTFSIKFSFNHLNSGSSHINIVSKAYMNGSDEETGNIDYRIFLWEFLKFQTNSETITSILPFISGWNSALVTYNNGHLLMYVNDVLDTSINYSIQHLIGNNTYNIKLLSVATGTYESDGPYFALDELKFYDSIITP